MTSVTFWKRGLYSVPAIVPAGAQVKVKRYSRAAVGGCKEATIEVTADDERDVDDFLNWLMMPVKIANDRGQMAWWGYVARVEVQKEHIRAVADIDSMANRIAVAYTTVAYGEETIGARMTTAWLQDDVSVGQFGIKEMLDGRGGINQTAAEALRARLLEQKFAPVVVFERMAGEKKTVATITCRGWWSTLNWRYASVPTRLALGFETIGSLTQTIGATDVVALAESFDVGSVINLQQVAIYAGSVGAPANDLTVAIWTNPDDLTPGAELASATIAAESVSSTPGWMTASFSTPLALAASTSYFLIVSTTGLDAANHYVFTLDGGQGYGAGVLRRRIGSTWSAGPAADLPFQLYSNDLVETTQQIKALVTNFGQFMGQVYIEDASGISTESYRNGDTDAQVEIEDMMDTGTTNKRRLFAEVLENQAVRIFEQPASTDYILMDNRGRFQARPGSEMDLSTCPVGLWVMPSGVISSNVDATLLLGMQQFLLEESEFDVESGELGYTPANLDNPWDLGVKRG